MPSDDIWAVRGLLNRTKEIAENAINLARSARATNDSFYMRYTAAVTWINAALKAATVAKGKVDDAISALQILINSSASDPHHELLEAMGFLNHAATDLEQMISNYLNMREKLTDMLPLATQNESLQPSNSLHLAINKMDTWSRRL